MNKVHLLARGLSRALSQARRRSFLVSWAAVTGIALLVSGTASADSVIGQANFGFGNVGVNSSGTEFFSFSTLSQECNANPGTGEGCFDVQSGDGTFVNLTSLVVPAMDNSIANIGPTITSQTYPVVDEIMLNGGASALTDGVSFDLTSIAPGSLTACTGTGDTYCAIYLNNVATPYALSQQTTNTVSVTATMYFNAYTHNSSNPTPYQGIFTTQVNGTIDGAQGILAEIVGGQTVVNSWDATFVPGSGTSNLQAAPEPGTLLLAGLGLIALSYVRRGRKKLAARQ